jgi:hypothetical protein
MAVPKMHNPSYENLCLNTSPTDATLKYRNTMLKSLLLLSTLLIGHQAEVEQTHGLPQGPSENALLPPEVMTKMSWEEQKAVS